MSALSPVEVEIIRNSLVYNYFEVASVIILVYDYIVTFPDEIQYIWNRRANFISVLFIGNRYLPFLDNLILLLAREFTPNPAESTCRKIFSLENYSYVFGIGVAEGVLIMRTYAIWEENKKLALGLTAILLSTGIASLIFIAKSLPKVHFIPSPAPIILPGCFLVQANRLIWIAFLVLTLFETLVLILTVYEILRQWRFKGSDLLYIIYRDGIAFYVCLLVLSIATMITLTVAPDALALSLTHIHRVMHATLTGRIILNIRSAAGHHTSRPTSQRLDSVIRRAELGMGAVDSDNVVLVPIAGMAENMSTTEEETTTKR